MLSRVSLRLRVPLLRVSFSTKFTVNDVRNQQQRTISCSKAEPAYLRIYERGLGVFAVGGFAFAIATSAALAYDDSRRNKNFSATVHVLHLFQRLVTFPLICSAIWPLIVASMFGYNFFVAGEICWKVYQRRIANRKSESENDK